MTTIDKLPRTSAALTIVAIAAMVFDLVILGILHFLRPDVDLIAEPTSNYAVGVYGSLSISATFVVGVGALALALALHREMSGMVSRPGLVLLAVFGVAKLAQAFFPIDIDPDVLATSAGAIHNLLGNIAFFALPLAAFFIGRSLGRWATLLAWALIASAVIVLASGSFGVFGIAQRVFLVLSSLWVLVAALLLRRADRLHG
jgi:hypothetical protein